MNIKTMEGLAGAGASISLISTPMSVAKEAERKGDTDKMQRALGYAAGMKEQADQYGEKAGEGMKADAEEMKEQEKMLREELTEARRRERKELEKRLKEEASGSEAGVSEGSDLDDLQISPEGKSQAESAGEGAVAGAGDTAAAKAGMEDTTYDSSGAGLHPAPAAGEYVDVTV